jgi:hypothetical protein
MIQDQLATGSWILTQPKCAASATRKRIKQMTQEAMVGALPELRMRFLSRNNDLPNSMMRRVRDDSAVLQGDRAPGVCGDFGFVGDQDDRATLGVELVEEFHHLGAGFAVEIAGRLVGEDQARVADQGARDRYPLALAARELLRAMFEPSSSSRCVGCTTNF